MRVTGMIKETKRVVACDDFRDDHASHAAGHYSRFTTRSPLRTTLAARQPLPDYYLTTNY